MSSACTDITESEAFEILCADCLLQESFPMEIQVIGRAHGWAQRMQRMANARGWNFHFSVEPKKAIPDAVDLQLALPVVYPTTM